ncbi:MarR family winged helix-turn-helix transcriptional regulator [Alteribacillus bidgolensis]|uniref:DNA-binding transcriptional regulator, MarR family n=1 Tax=Alteribacillus bidgolensis TaxID=930129 RepID=A0A1G8CWZ5_9BACI|nr:MarR family transcriptional regulator [Alteribacillus bidgolensis]SDH50011.1 DNA-binding transcriptional regulator, MarR family [Alteribacillus bidgolensis]
MNKSYFPILICLIRGLSKVMEADLNKSAKKLDLTITELNFLWTIFYEEEPTVSRIAELTILDSSTVTQVLSRLKKKQLVSIYKKGEDSRFSYVKLTNKGNKKRELSTTYNEYTLLKFFYKELDNPEERKKMEITLDYLRKINHYFHGEEFVNWVYSLPKKLEKELEKNDHF